jgi:hypothetical protein
LAKGSLEELLFARHPLRRQGPGAFGSSRTSSYWVRAFARMTSWIEG